MSEQTPEHTPSPVRKSYKIFKKFGRKTVIMAAVVVLLALGAGAAYILYKRSHTTEKVAPGPGIEKQFESEQTLAQKEVEKAKTPQEKAKAYMEVGRTAYNVGEYKNAINAYEIAVSLDPSLKENILAQLPYAYAATGNNKKAIELMTELLKIKQNEAKTDPFAATAAKAIENDLQRLQKGQDL